MFFHNFTHWLIPLEIVQKLCDYRNKLAYKAIGVVITYFRSQFEVDKDSDLDDLNDELAEFARELVNADPGHAFIFKGMENSHKVSQRLRIFDTTTSNVYW